MKKLILILALLAAVIANGQFLIGGGSPGSIPVASDILVDELEPGNYQGTNVWTESGAGTIDENYSSVATNILSGSESLLMVSSAQTVNTYVVFANQSSCVGYMKFKRLSSSSNYRLFSLRNSSGTVVAQYVLDNNQKLTVRAGSGTAIVGTDSVPQGPLVHLRWEYTKGSGANAFASVEFSTNGTFNGYNGGANTKYVRDTAGNAITDAGRLMLGADNSTGFNVVWDRILIATDLAHLNP